MSATINTLFKITASVVGANALKDFSDQIAKASTGGQNLARTLNQGSMALKAFAYSEAVQGLKELVTSSIDLGAHINDINQKTGVSVQLLGQFYGAAKQAGIGLDDVAEAAVQLNKSLIASQDSGSKQAAAFAALGIKTKDAAGNLKEGGAVLLEMANRFHDTADGAGKSTAAVDLLGKAGANMIPILDKGADAIQNLGIKVGTQFTENASEFNDNIVKIQTQFDQLSVDIASQLLPGLISLSEGFEANNTAVELLVGLIKTLETSFVGLSLGATVVMEYIGAGFAELSNDADAFGDKLKALATLNTKAFKEINERQGLAEKAISDQANDNIAAAAAKARKDIDAIWSSKIGEGAAAGPARKETAPKPTIKLDPAASSQFAAAAKAASDWLLKQQEGLITLRQEADYIGKTTVEIEKLKDAREIETQIAEKAKNMSQAQAAAFKDQASKIEQARQAIIQYNYDQARTFGAGSADFFAKYTENATDTASQVKKVLGDAFKGAEDALVDFTTTGKLNFKSFASSVIQDLIRIQIQRSILAPLSSWLGSFFPGGGGAAPVTASANGNIMTSNGPLALKKYAMGGVASSPQVSIFGEGRLPEAYVPLPDGRSIPVTMSGGGTSGVGDVNVSVVFNQSGQSQESAAGSNQRGATFGRAVAAAVKAQILEEKRPGGLLS